MSCLGCFLLFVFINTLPSYAAIEVYSAGKHFNSFEDYRKTDEDVSLERIKLLDSKLVEYQETLKQDQQRMDHVSYDGQVNHGIVNFKKTSPSRYIFNSDELEYALKEAIGNHNEPALLIFNPQKIRVMSLDKDRSSHQVENIDKSHKK